jgi:hypothetical protein
MQAPIKDESLPASGRNYDRREFLKCAAAWAGTGIVLTAAGGVLTSCELGDSRKNTGTLSFVQISDTHIGFV